MRTTLGIVATLLLLTACASQAIPTGLNAMPTANVLGMGQTRVTYIFDGSGLLYADEETSTVFGTQSGLAFGLEAGVDDVDGKGTVYNLKWRMIPEGFFSPAFALGVQNITSGERPQYYAVMTKSVLPMRVAQISAGAMYDENKDTIGMVGAGVYLGPLTVKADHISGGDKERTSMGASLTFSSFTAGVARFAYDDGRPDDTTYLVSYGARY